MNTRKLSIIVPAYNEEKTVGTVIERLLKVPFQDWDVEIIAINDGSSDGTASALEKFVSVAKVINMPQNGGKGAAVRAGIDSATGDYAIIQDADLECAPEEIPSLLEALNGVSMGDKVAVMGSRELGKDTHKSEFIARLGSLSITKLINILYRSSLTDSLMGYKMFPKETFGNFKTGGFESEMLFLCSLLRDGYDIREVPVSYDPRDKESGKKISYRHGFIIIKRIIGFWLKGGK